MEGKDPVKVIRDAIAKALVFYYPFAGRLREYAGRKLVVECTGEGVMFIEADADVTLQQFGDALYPPFPCLEKLLYDVPGSAGMVNCPLLLIQVTRLKCGGFIFALRFNRTMNDAAGIVQFMSAVGEFARGAEAPSIPPVWQRHLLNTHYPPSTHTIEIIHEIQTIFMKMEFEHHHHHYRLRDNLNSQSFGNNNTPLLGKNDHSSSSSADNDGDHDFISHRIESFHVLDKGVPRSNDSIEKKLCWLRSQIIGGTAEFDTPFGRRHLTYADHTASGRSLHYIENYITTNLLPFYGNSHTSDSYVGYQTTKMVHEAAKYVKKCLGGGEEDAIIFCGSGSTAAIKRLQEVMGMAIPSILRERMLKCLSNEERWVVFVGPYEHHSNILSWRQSLAEVVEIGLDHHGLIDMGALRQKLDFYKAKNRPILGSFSACSNVTGICTNTRAIARLLHQFGGFACFDFAASGPYTKIEMRSGEIDGYDAIFLSTHKFVGGPGSPGILLMSKTLYRLGSSPPSTCGGGTVNFVNGYNDKDTIYVDNIEEREDAGTPAIIQKIRGALAFWIKEYIGYKGIERQEKRYIGRALERLVPNQHICVLGNTTAKRQAILSFLIYSTTAVSSSANKIDEQLGEINKGRLDLWRETGNTRGKPLHGPFVAKLLNDLFGIQARGGCACAGPYGHNLLNVDEPHSLAFRSVIEKGYAGIKPGWARVSFPYYMSEEEFEFILAAIEFIAIYGQRFLNLYHFNWKTGAWTFKKNALKAHNNSILNASSLSNMIKALNLEHDEIQENMKEDVLPRYTNYLETAKRIASLLPKFPPHRKIPQAIDIDLVPFRV